MQLRVPQGLPLADAERLPCRVAYRGPVEHAEAYFPPPPDEEWQVEGGGEGEERTYAFRGRGLRWQVVPLPDDSQAYVLRHEEAEKGVVSAATYGVRRLGYYTHEKEPNAGDPLPAAVRWLGVAAALHAPLEAEAEVDAVGKGEQDGGE